MYKQRQNLTYPINMARNIAKISSQTHLTFPSDIELYPTRNFIKKFLTFILNNPFYLEKGSRNVFVLPVFEILEGYEVKFIINNFSVAYSFYLNSDSKRQNYPPKDAEE